VEVIAATLGWMGYKLYPKPRACLGLFGLAAFSTERVALGAEPNMVMAETMHAVIVALKASGAAFLGLLLFAGIAWYWALLVGFIVMGCTRQTICFIRFVRGHPRK